MSDAYKGVFFVKMIISRREELLLNRMTGV
jgi:hypothetical protein